MILIGSFAVLHRRYRNFVVIAVLALSCAPLVPADDTDKKHEHQYPAAPVDTTRYAATTIPDRVILTWTGAPETSQAVTWRTSVDVTKAWGEIAIASANPGFESQAKKVDASSQPLTTNLGAAHYHTVEFTELKPETRYAYRVGDGRNFSEWFHFTTASLEAKPFRFIYFGDAQNNIRSLWSRVVREAHRDAPRAAFLLHAGDLVNKAESDAEWGDWSAAGRWLNGMMPSMAVPGNHEQAKQEDGSKALSHHWRPQFAFPTHGPEGLEETCYTLVHQGVRFVCMNSNERHEDQALWMDQVLTENKARWVICSFHHPIYSTGGERDNAELRAMWKPILDKHKVDLVLQGHDHTYGRTGLDTPIVEPAEAIANVMDGVNLADSQTGTVYVVSVSGPKMYSLQKHPFMKRQAEKTQLYQIIEVNGDQLHYEARTAIGQPYDAFTLKKQDGKINLMMERVPENPATVSGDTADTIPVSSPKFVAAKVKELFALQNKNDDDVLSGDEIPDNLRERVMKYDADGNQKISKDELREIVKSWYQISP
ncbi:MAG: fibronectin type III domain-containing protein [Fuerstiella sp.]